jgi:hypothetical protein
LNEQSIAVKIDEHTAGTKTSWKTTTSKFNTESLEREMK